MEWAGVRALARPTVPTHWYQSRRKCGSGELRPGADVAGGEPGPGANVAAVSSVPAQMWQGVSPVPAQMWQGVSPVPVQMWQGGAQSRCRCGSGELSPGADVAGTRLTIAARPIGVLRSCRTTRTRTRPPPPPPLLPLPGLMCTSIRIILTRCPHAHERARTNTRTHLSLFRT